MKVQNFFGRNVQYLEQTLDIKTAFISHKSVLIFGPSKSGKVSLASFLANELNYSVVLVRASSLYSRYVGETEEKIRKLFDDMKNLSRTKKSLCVLRSIDLLVEEKEDFLKDVRRRIVSTFLNSLDGVDTVKSGRLIFCFTSIRGPETFPESFMRPGRIEIHLQMDYPNYSIVEEILREFNSSLNIDKKLSFPRLMKRIWNSWMIFTILVKNWKTNFWKKLLMEVIWNIWNFKKMKKFISHESEGFLNNEKIEINRSRWESQQVWMTYLRLDVDPEIYLRCLLLKKLCRVYVNR